MTMLKVPYALGQIGVSGSADKFEKVGFSVSPNGLLSVLNGSIAFSGEGESGSFLGLGVVGDEIPAEATLDGIPVVNSVVAPPVDHGNGAFELDHLVILTPDLDRTVHQADAVLGLRQLRLREEDGERQSFHRFADVTHPDGTVTKGCVLEIVHDARVPNATLWGFVFNTYDLNQMASRYGEEIIRPPQPAVQPGREIAPFRSGADLGVQVAMMSPPPASTNDPLVGGQAGAGDSDGDLPATESS